MKIELQSIIPVDSERKRFQFHFEGKIHKMEVPKELPGWGIERYAMSIINEHIKIEINDTYYHKEVYK